MSEEAVRNIVIDTINRAGAESGWVSMMFAAIVFGGLISLAVVVWQVLRAYFDTQSFIRDKLLGVLAESNQIISRCADAMKDSSEAMRHFADAIGHAPCGQRPNGNE